MCVCVCVCACCVLIRVCAFQVSVCVSVCCVGLYRWLMFTPRTKRGGTHVHEHVHVVNVKVPYYNIIIQMYVLG